MLFSPSQVYMPNRHRQRSAIRTFFPSSSFSPPDSKEPLRRGILFSSVAAVLLLVGAILTWLGFNDVFGGKISMTGPLLIALALLMLLLSLRQFMLAKKRNLSTSAPVQMEAVGAGGVTAVVVDHDDGNGAATIVVETWDSEEQNNDTLSYRNSHELAPPSYMDIAQSCSSTCPSFISHEDHNEAPPTYEETCGMYNSQTSLTNDGSHCCSFHYERSPSPQRTNHSGYNFFQNESPFDESYEMFHETDEPDRSSDICCPKTGTAVSQPVNYQTPVDCRESNLPLPESSRNTATHSKHFLPCTREISRVDSNPASCVANNKTLEWSRRSFSSIPSYTCLLSESGEVSSHVFDTSSIIEEMMPLLVMQGRDPATTELLMGQTIIPTRSHSMSSVNTCRQGVPYNSHSHSSQTTPKTVIQPSQSPHGQHHQPRTSSPNSLSHTNTCEAISKSTSFPLPDPHLNQGSEAHLLDLLAAQPVQVGGPALLQPLMVGTSSSPWHTKETSEQGNLGETQLGALDVRSRTKSESSLTTVSQDSNTSDRGMLSNTQDVQETI